jgi:hypothetical protein
MQNVERRYLLRFEEIIGIAGYLDAWKDIDNICVILIDPDRSQNPQYSPVFNELVSAVHQVWYDRDCDQICWREVCKDLIPNNILSCQILVLLEL